MDYLVIFLRLVHIAAGIFWVGAALMLNFFIAPAARGTGEAGQQVIRHLMVNARLNSRIAAAAGATILAGALLYWLDSDGLTSAWRSSGPGIGFGIGGVAGFIGFILGIMVGRYNQRLVRLGSEIKAPPSPDQMKTLTAIQKSLTRISPLMSLFLILSILFMAAARYLVF